MPMSNADNPAADKPDAAAESEPATKKSKAARAEEPAPELARAFTSGNAEVHNLVAKREIAVSNGDAAAVAAADAELAALGYRV